MNTNNNIQLAAQNVINAVNIISSQQSCSQEQFHQANLIVSTILGNQDFRFMFDIGAYLTRHNVEHDANILNFALKLIETAIRLHWKYINDATKDELKAFLESILQTQDSNAGCQPLLAVDGNTPRHILNSLSKCFCEVIKCDWPQRWPQLFDKLLATKKNLIVIFIILRLAEDVGTFCEPADNIRRREISQGLNNRILSIYTYLVDCISSQDIQLMKSSIECLNALSIWAQFNNDLAKFLCQFIRECKLPIHNINGPIVTSEIDIKRSACEVLIVILERKHSKADNIEVRTSLFEDETNLNNLILSLKEVHQSSLSEISQEKFELEKKLCQIFAHIVRYVHVGPPEKPQNLQDIYDVMKIAINHSSITVSAQAVNFWLKVYVYAPKKPIPSISQEMTVSLLLACATKLVKLPYDSQLYGFELDCHQDYDVFQVRYRSDLCELCRYLTIQNERISFELICNSLAKALQQSNTSLNEWDALASLSSSVCSKLVDLDLFYRNGIELIKLLLLSMDKELMQTANVQSSMVGSEAKFIPDLISSQLSCVSALCIFLPNWHFSNKELTKQILDKIIILAFHRPDKTNASSRQLVGNNTNLLQNESFLKGFRALSRHASACFVRICLNHSKHLLSIFDDVRSSVDSIFATAADNPFSSEKCQLYEGLTIIGNEEPNDIYRKKFALELLATVDWFKTYELNCDQFINFVGLDRIEGEQDMSNISTSQSMISQQALPSGQLNRVKLCYVVTFLYALTRRISSRQTLLPELLSFVKPVLNILHSMHSLWLPEMQVKCLKEYHKVLFAQVSSSYRQQILETLLVNQKSSGSNEINYPALSDDQSVRSQRGEAHYIDLFCWNFYESLLNCIGSIITKASPELFNMIGTVHLQSALRGAEYLPPLKLHKLIKSFIMPIVGVCCQDQQLIEQQLLPVLSNFLPFMFNQLDNQWKLDRENDNNENFSGSDNQDLADEMVRTHLLRSLSIDFIDLMNMILVEKNQLTTNNTITNSNDTQLLKSRINPDVPNHNNEQIDLFKISNLGLNLLAARPDFVIIVMTSTLTWGDSTLNTKSVSINSHLIKHLLSVDLIKTFEETSLLFRNIITSLGMFGEHEQNCSGLVQLFLQLYEGLKKKTSNFSNHMAHLTSIESSLFDEYEKKTLNCNEKTRRVQMRKLLDKLIGKNIGQRYKVETNH